LLRAVVLSYTGDRMDVRLYVPGRICLFGDKIDIAHKPVIAAAIDMFLHVSATAGGE